MTTTSQLLQELSLFELRFLIFYLILERNMLPFALTAQVGKVTKTKQLW